jgi:chemotaxis signal transduction protein
MACSIRSEFIAGVGKLKDRLLILLDLDKLFGDLNNGSTDMKLDPEAAKLFEELMRQLNGE